MLTSASCNFFFFFFAYRKSRYNHVDETIRSKVLGVFNVAIIVCYDNIFMDCSYHLAVINRVVFFYDYEALVKYQQDRECVHSFTAMFL